MYFHMDIDKVLSNARLTSAILGVTKREFEDLLITFEQVLIEYRTDKKRKRSVGGGRIGRIKPAQNKLFFILWYLKVYPTFDVAAYVFSSSKTKTHVWVHNILPLLEKTLGRKVVLPKRQIRTPEEFLEAFPQMQEVMIDGLERPTVRSKKDKVQKKHYSGKKKRHTRKNVVVTNASKSILLLTPTKHGRVHDKKFIDKFLLASSIPKTVSILADTGFQGLQKMHPNVLLPKKKPRGGTLTDEDKAMNRLVSSVRISVEHAIGGIKRFKVASDIFRNKNGLDDRFMNVSAGLWNLHIKLQ
jgi:hypothetical protein